MKKRFRSVRSTTTSQLRIRRKIGRCSRDACSLTKTNAWNSIDTGFSVADEESKKMWFFLCLNFESQPKPNVNKNAVQRIDNKTNINSNEQPSDWTDASKQLHCLGDGVRKHFRLARVCLTSSLVVRFVWRRRYTASMDVGCCCQSTYEKTTNTNGIWQEY